MTRETDIDAQAVRELLSYEAETGDLVWRVNRGRYYVAGRPAGSVTRDGYRRVSILGARVHAHRLAWAHVHGEWPSGPIDHIDGNRTNNAISNLRVVTKRVNSQNQRHATRASASGVLGVWAVGSRWRAAIKDRGRSRYLGYFDSANEAHEAYVTAKRRLHEGCTL